MDAPVLVKPQGPVQSGFTPVLPGIPENANYLWGQPLRGQPFFTAYS